MLRLRLERFAYHPEGTLGYLYLPNGTTLATVEKQWAGNAQNKSCIPEGVYRCQPFSGSKYKDVYEITEVPERSAILFHSANWPHQLQGCIAPGLKLTPAKNGLGVMNSRAAMEVLKAACGTEPFEVEITGYRPEYP